MKTSNKILLFIGIALLISPFINAYSLKQKLSNKEYTLRSMLNEGQSEIVAISPTDSIHIVGGNNLAVRIIKSDSTSVEKDKNSNVYLYKENGVLTIQHSNNQDVNSGSYGVVTIKTSSIKAISFEGKLIVDSIGNKYRSSVTKYYAPFEITVKGFKANQLNIQGLNGGGTLVLVDNHIKDLLLNIGEFSNVNIDSTNHFDLLQVQSSKNPAITLDGTYINSLRTNLGSKAWLTLKGNNIENIVTYK